MVDDTRTAQSGGLEQNPRYGNVVGKIYTRNRGDKQHQQREILAIVADSIIFEVLLRVNNHKCSYDNQQNVEQRSKLVECEELARCREVCTSEKQVCSKYGVRGDVQSAHYVDSLSALGKECSCGNYKPNY